jgi:hypothetical protein
LDVESIACDTDVVFLQNPQLLFSEDSDFEVMAEEPVPDFNSDFDFSVFNVGFMRVRPSEIAISVYQAWFRAALDRLEILDQEAFTALLKPFRPERSLNQIQVYNVTELLGQSAVLRMKFYHPLLVINGRLMRGLFGSATEVALARRIRRPCVCHLSWVKREEKMAVFEEKGLVFWAGKCVVPEQKAFAAWNPVK